MNDEVITITGEYYKPKNKQERFARQRVWDRYRAMADDTLRKEAEEKWDRADKMFMQWMPERAVNDWRSHIVLPDAFAGVQAHMQETINRKSRPVIQLSDSSDMAREMFANAIMKNNMDRTGYDFQEFLSKQCAAIRGTGFRMEYYRLDKRDVQDPVDVNDDGTLKYEKKEIIDFDDTYTEFIENEFIFLDPDARLQDQLRDFIHREILDWKEFRRIYGKRPDFMNVDSVPKAGIISAQVKYWQKAHDMTDDDVEVLHYYNRSTDSYDVLANNVLIRLGPLPYKHKELPLVVDTFYHVPGKIYGMGIPEVIYSLSEERTTFRRMSSDRMRMQIDKMFLVNDLVDLDEEDVRTRPHGFIPVNTNGLQLGQVIEPIEYGDIPASYYNIERMLLDDIRRAHGITDQMEAVQNASTATESALLQQTAQKRIQMINMLSEMDTVVRLGRLKWSNIQFFYPAPRVEIITQGDEGRIKKTYRKIKVEGKEFSIVKDPGTNQTKIAVNDIDGTSGFTLNRSFARFMDGDWEVVIIGDGESPLPKPLRQAKVTEMMNTLTLNPQLMSAVDPKKAVKRYVQINDEDPKDWMRDTGMTDTDWKRLAIHENLVMMSGQVLSPTQDAPTVHTEEHLNFMNSKDFDALPDGIKAIFQEHMLGEHQANPQTGNVADLMGGAPKAGAAITGTLPQGGQSPQIPAGDMTPSTGGGSDMQDTVQANAGGGGAPAPAPAPGT